MEISPTTINYELLDSTLAYIEAHPEGWNQAHWFLFQGDDSPCGTACCFAGRVVVNDGAVPVFFKYDDPCSEVLEPAPSMKSTWVKYPDIHPYGGGYVNVEVRARDLLGLTDYQADALFSGSNNLDDLREIIQRLRDDPAWFAPRYDDDDD